MSEGEQALTIDALGTTDITNVTEVHISELSGMSQDDLEKLVVPGTRFVGFNDISSLDGFVESIGSSLAQHLLPPEQYAYYKGGFVTRGGLTPIESLARSYTGVPDKRRVGLSKPASVTILEPDKSGLNGLENVNDMTINLAVSGQFGMRYRVPTADDGPNPKYTRSYDVEDQELIIFVREKQQGPGEPKPYLYCTPGNKLKLKQTRAYVENHDPEAIQSYRRWRDVIIDGLKHAYSAGAPGLGKGA